MPVYHCLVTTSMWPEYPDYSASGCMALQYTWADIGAGPRTNPVITVHVTCPGGMKSYMSADLVTTSRARAWFDIHWFTACWAESSAPYRTGPCTIFVGESQKWVRVGDCPPIPSSQVGVPVRDILRFLSAGHVSSRVASQQVEIGKFLFSFCPRFLG